MGHKIHCRILTLEKISPQFLCCGLHIVLMCDFHLCISFMVYNTRLGHLSGTLPWLPIAAKSFSLDKVKISYKYYAKKGVKARFNYVLFLFLIIKELFFFPFFYAY